MHNQLQICTTAQRSLFTSLFSFIQIAFSYFGMNHIGCNYQTRKWFVKKIEPPLTAFTFLVPQQNNVKKKKEEEIKN